jgi:hypothetical protein
MAVLSGKTTAGESAFDKYVKNNPKWKELDLLIEEKLEAVFYKENKKDILATRIKERNSNIYEAFTEFKANKHNPENYYYYNYCNLTKIKFFKGPTNQEEQIIKNNWQNIFSESFIYGYILGAVKIICDLGTFEIKKNPISFEAYQQKFDFVKNQIEYGNSFLVNLTAPTPATNAEVTKAMSKVFNRPSLLPVPAFALKTILGEFSQEVLGSARVIPRVLLDAGFVFQDPNIESAMRTLATK